MLINEENVRGSSKKRKEKRQTASEKTIDSSVNDEMTT